MMNTKNNFIVGFLETIFSKRIINQKEVICCSLAQWYVEKEFRLYSYAFFFPLLEKRIIISATAPRKSLIGFFKKFNFDIQSLKYSAGFGINFLSFFSQNYKRFEILDKEIDILNELNKKDKKIYQDHKKFNCINFVIKDKTQKTESLYFLLKRKKRYNLNVLDILYISNINECKKYAPEICTKICLRSKNIFIGQIYSNDNDKLKYNPNFVIKTVRKLFPFKKINDESFSDYLYSEQIMFND